MPGRDDGQPCSTFREQGVEPHPGGFVGFISLAVANWGVWQASCRGEGPDRLPGHVLICGHDINRFACGKMQQSALGRDTAGDASGHRRVCGR